VLLDVQSPCSSLLISNNKYNYRNIIKDDSNNMNSEVRTNSFSNKLGSKKVLLSICSRAVGLLIKRMSQDAKYKIVCKFPVIG
jgi:hypothetical protein